MRSHTTNDFRSVTLADRKRFEDGDEAGSSPQEQRDVAAAEVLSAQWTARVSGALVIAAIQLVVLLSAAGKAYHSTTIGEVLATVGSYVLLISMVHVIVLRRGRASPALVTVALFSDLAFLHGLTYAAATPHHYERALFGTIVVVHVANFFFGKRQAWRVVQAGIAGYLLLLASAALRGLPFDVGEELWTLAICSSGLVVIVLQTSAVRRRLHTIVQLFEHAEDGDFSREYDVSADGRPDAITRVGQAYNGVRAQLASMVLTDSLTTCLNRRGFDQALAREVGRATRAGSEFALLAIDLDHFKQINDTFGHLAGDYVLREVGRLLGNAGRAGDVVARVGGEEFAILLADTGAGGAHLFASRLCERIRSHSFEIGEHLPAVVLTTSIGCAVGSPRDVEDFAELLWSRADEALYEAKRSGRDCVRTWTSATRRSGEFVSVGWQPTEPEEFGTLSS